MSQDLQVVVGPGPRIAGEETQSVQGAVQLAVDLDHSVTSHTKSLFSPLSFPFGKHFCLYHSRQTVVKLMTSLTR